VSASNLASALALFTAVAMPADPAARLPSAAMMGPRSIGRTPPFFTFFFFVDFRLTAIPILFLIHDIDFASVEFHLHLSVADQQRVTFRTCRYVIGKSHFYLHVDERVSEPFALLRAVYDDERALFLELNGVHGRSRSVAAVYGIPEFVVHPVQNGVVSLGIVHVQ